MGNCCTTSSMEWAGDDWGSLTSKHKGRTMNSRKVFDEIHHHHEIMNLGNLEKEKLLGALREAYSSDCNGKVKITISKKELAKLLGETENTKGEKHASPEQVLVRLMNARDHDAHHRHWKPVLQSIPEVN